MKDFLEKAHDVNYNPSLFFDEVLVTVGSVAMEEEGIVGEEAAKTVDAVGRQGGADAVAQVFVDGCGGHPVAFAFVEGRFEVLVEVLNGGWRECVLAVVGDDFVHVRFVEPVTLMIQHSCHGLGVKLVVVDAVADVDAALQRKDDEASAASRVTQQIHLVGCADERGATRKNLHMTAIGALDLYRRQLDEVLQEALLNAG